MNYYERDEVKMGIFTTREIVIFIYGILLLTYILVRKKGKDILLPVIKAACHIKLIIPFCLVLLFAAGFVWACTYLPIWDWIYVKDIVFWTLFVGVPVCFNATNRKLEEQYFKNILVDNFKFTALVEFITGTFTFPFIGELILQPVLVFLMILQSSLVKKTEATKKVVDGIVGIAGLIIMGLTIKSIVEAIDEIYFMDILIGLALPIILSIIYLPVAYFFALYAKYEILFMRMGFKETDDIKLRRKYRIEVIRCCKFSYKEVCRFLNEYVQKMYVRMSTSEFETIIDEFRGTTEHTYCAAIKYNGKYYVSRALTPNSDFGFNIFTINKGGLFRNSNKELRKEIALQIQSKTPFKNTKYNSDRTCCPVCLKKVFLFNKNAFFKRTKIAIFCSNEIEENPHTINLLFGNNIRDHCDNTTIKLMRILKWNTIGPSFVAAFFYFVSFVLASVIQNDTTVDLDVVAFVFAVINHLYLFLNCKCLTKLKIFKKLVDLRDWLFIGGLLELVVFIISLFVSMLLQPIEINSFFLSKLGIAFIFFDALVDMVKRDQ